MSEQLHRWLNITPVTKLERVRKFVSLPAFSVNYTWRGYSDLVAAFNYAAPNNFSFVNLTLPTDPNFLLCVAYQDSSGVKRYKMWEDVSEIVYFDAPLYTNQLVKKNFRFEVWSVGAPLTPGGGGGGGPIPPPIGGEGSAGIVGEDGGLILGEVGPIVGEL